MGSYPGGNVPRFAIVLRGICPERVQLSGGQFSSGAIIWGVNNPGGNHPEGNCSEEQLSGGTFPQEQLSGHHCVALQYLVQLF